MRRKKLMRGRRDCKEEDELRPPRMMQPRPNKAEKEEGSRRRRTGLDDDDGDGHLLG